MEMELSEEDKAAKERKAAAAAEKAKGNEAYKARRFEEALTHYDAAVQLDDSDISFLTNKCGGPQGVHVMACAGCVPHQLRPRAACMRSTAGWHGSRPVVLT